METSALTYENWLAGKIELDSTCKYYKDTPEIEVKVYSLNSFQEIEASKIRSKQERFFFDEVDKLSKTLRDDFNKRFIESPSPLATLKVEEKRIVGIIRGPIVNLNNDILLFKYGNLTIEKESKRNFQNNLNRRIEGRAIIPDFMPSPNSYYFDKGNLIPEVFIESLINLFLHLKKFDDSLDLSNLFVAPFMLIYGKEPENIYPQTFTSGWAYKYFLWCEEILVQEKTKPGDYSFVYQVLSNPKIGVFNAKISQDEFFKFLKLSRGFDLNIRSNKPSKSEAKISAMKFILRRYLRSIKEIPKNEIENYIQRVIEKKTT